MANKPAIKRGRGAVSNPHVRYHQQQREGIDDGWYTDAELPTINTTIHRDNSRSILTTNQSPDVPFDVSINPYRGCEHGCIYCFARPTHAYLDFSPGLDFETQLVIKPDAPQLLRKKLAASNYQCKPIAMGTNTDPYQPIEREHRITRQILEVLEAHHHPVAIVTKSSMIERDMDILSRMAQRQLVQVMISVCTLDKAMARTLEPRATTPQRRMQTIATLNNAGIPTGILTAPVIPVLNDPEMELILERAAAAGVQNAGYVLLRLPLEVAPLFDEWLQTHYPLKHAHVMKRVRDTRTGKVYQHQFGTRMTGEGAFAAMINRRFQAACRRFDIGKRTIYLDTHQFTSQCQASDQLALF